MDETHVLAEVSAWVFVCRENKRKKQAIKSDSEKVTVKSDGKKWRIKMANKSGEKLS